MLQTLTTMISILTAGSAAAVIGLSLAEDWSALRLALGAGQPDAVPPLPARTRQVAAPRRAQMVRITPESSASRAAA